MGFMVYRKSALILTLKEVNWVYFSTPNFKSHFNNILSFTPKPQKLLHVFLSLFLCAFVYPAQVIWRIFLTYLLHGAESFLRS